MKEQFAVKELTEEQISGTWYIVRYSTVQYSTVQYSTVQYSTVQYIIPTWVSLPLPQPLS